MSPNVSILGAERNSAGPTMGGQQAVERVSSPGEVETVTHQGQQRNFVQHETSVLCQAVVKSSLQFQSPDLVQKL